MNVYKKLGSEDRRNIRKIYIPIIIAAIVGYLLYLLIDASFFVGWEIYFIMGCYGAILLTLFIIDLKIIYLLHYDIYIENNKLNIKDGFLYRTILIPIDRLYYISSVKAKKGLAYDSIFITDKRINHKKIKPLKEKDFSGKNEAEHLKAIEELKFMYPGKKFYYYRVFHDEYKFYYYFYMIFRYCEKCKLSDTSMELVKKYAYDSGE